MQPEALKEGERALKSPCAEESQKNRSLSAFCVAIYLVVDYTLLTVCGPILPNALETEYGDFVIGLVFATKNFVQVLASLFMGSFVARFGEFRTLWLAHFCLFVSSAFLMGALLISPVNLPWIIIARAIHGLASSCGLVAGMTWVTKAHPGDDRSAAMGYAHTGVAAGVLVGPVLGGFLNTYVSSYSSFALICGLVFISSLLFGFIARNNSLKVIESLIEDSRKTTQITCGGVFNLSMFPVLCLVSLANMWVGLLEPLIPLHLGREFQLSSFYQGATFSAYSFIYLVCTAGGGVLAGTVNKSVMAGAGILVVGAGMGVQAYYAIATSVVGLCIVGCGLAFVETSCFPLLADIADMKGLSYDTVLALEDISMSIGFVIGPIVGTIVLEISSYFIIAIAGFGACVIGFLVLFPLLWRSLRTSRS